jgi:chorismate mutase
MSDATDLDALRDEIDRIDDQLHDCLLRRTALVGDIAAVKERQAAADEAATVYVNPGREATVLRRRLDQHSGKLPRAVVARLWRELIGAFCHLQRPQRVLIHAPAKSVGYWDLARNHFGSIAAMSVHTSAQRVLREVAENDRAIGLLTLPEDNETNPWWPQVVAGHRARLFVVARLPFYTSASGQFEDLAALVVAPFAPQPSGDDVSLMAVETGETSRARLGELMTDAGLKGHVIASYGDDDPGARLQLYEATGFVGQDDDRVTELLNRHDSLVRRIIFLGAYAVPVGRLD